MPAFVLLQRPSAQAKRTDRLPDRPQHCHPDFTCCLRNPLCCLSLPRYSLLLFCLPPSPARCVLPAERRQYGVRRGGGGGERRATKTDRRRKARGGRTGRGTGGRQKKKALGCWEGGQASAQQWYWGYASALLLIKGRSGLNGQTRKGRGLAPWEGGGAAGGIAVGTARAGRCAKRMGITQGGRVGGRDGERAKRAGRAPAQQGAPPPPAVVVVHRGGGLKARVVSGGFWSGGSCWCARLQGRSTQPQAWRGRPSRRRRLAPCLPAPKLGRRNGRARRCAALSAAPSAAPSAARFSSCESGCTLPERTAAPPAMDCDDEGWGVRGQTRRWQLAADGDEEEGG